MKLSINGTELYFDVVGSGLDATSGFRQKATLIILHGGPGFDHTYLRPWLDPVSEVAQLVYIDERGCGRSERHTNEYYQLGIMADDIVLFCKTLDIERPMVLGQSFGGFVALSMALRHPDFMSGIVLFDTSPAWTGGYDLDALEQLVDGQRGKELREVAYKESTGTATPEELKRFEQEIMPLYWHQGFKPEYIAELFGNPLVNMDIATYMMGTLSKEYDMRSYLSEIKVPALVLQGRYDWVTPMTGAEEMAQAIPNGQLHIFEHSGHMVFMEEPEELVAVLKQWITNVK
ncbi:MAG: alpha/beta fold hydrolase [Ktedonobacteraceae bacterium]|jgi:proline iminopeptidase